MENKRGISHLEAILAFVFFIGFLIFAFIFFNPFSSNRTLDSSLEYAFIEIKQFAEVEVVTYSISMASTAPNLIAIKIQNTPQGANASVEDANGNIIPSYTASDGAVHFDRNGKNFARIKYRKVFDAGNSGITGTLIINGTNYTISSSTSKKVFSEKRALELNSSYYFDYPQLKKQFNLPDRIDFGFAVSFSDGYLIKSQGEVPEGLEVFGNTDRIEVARSGGKIEFADLIVNVW